ncbi:MAG: DUF433 domain-containing protein [Verrucomicrobia bacterium]|nr:DUF433 domain-containing protein [Verrucomicrobiota bacterium]
MIELPMTQSVPLTRGEDGVCHVTGSRVTLDSIVHLFQSGASAEQIQEDFPSLALSDIYALIAYVLQHPRAVKQYLDQQTQAAQQVRREVESNLDTSGLRERLRARRARAVA